MTRVGRAAKKEEIIEVIGCALFGLMLVAVGILYLSFYGR